MIFQKFKIVLVSILLVLFVLFLVFFTYKMMKDNHLDSQYVSGLLGSIVGGVFTLTSVWLTTELQEVKKSFDGLPIKIRKLSQLSNVLWRLKEEVGQDNVSDINKLNSELLDLAAEIDGKTYSSVLTLRELLLKYYYENINCRDNRNDFGEHVLIKTEEYISLKSRVYEMILEKYKNIIGYEELLTNKYK
ncbi:hypothetical protein GXP70_07890 [Paenibacillus lycopersici]|uniref:Uncharacterized protein n=1 Tax=Paenibacillus lycopersici TaxID=2704462 RepID=A0A6C0FRW4_9BACL|nr:hypothetical protein [Paenibacillus lycopersici]QHT59878.1 hypothetical protein GXP70_07890 [Paenibacillus lycopersici]